MSAGRPLRSAPVVAALVTLLATPCGAAWYHFPDVNTPVCVALGSQYLQDVAPDGRGGMLLTFTDDRTGTLQLYAQRLSPAGLPMWGAFGLVICSGTQVTDTPRIASDGAAGAIVVWQDARGTSDDIYVQRVDSTGVARWTAQGVALCTATGDQLEPTITADGSGGAIIAWSDLRSGTTDVYARRINGAGGPQWTANGVALCNATGGQGSAAICADGFGGAIVAWADSRATPTRIYAQRVNSSGAAQWTSNGVLAGGGNPQREPAIVSDGLGGAIVVWEDDYLVERDLRAQRFGSSGSTLWSGGIVSAATGSQALHDIIADGFGGVIVAWQDDRGGDSEIYAQRMNAAGSPLWAADGLALTSDTELQSNPKLTTDGGGGAIVAWWDSRYGTSFYDLFARHVTSTGKLEWATNGVALSTAIDNQVRVDLVPDLDGGAIAAWTDYRPSTTTDLYGQWVDRFGKLGDAAPDIVRVRDVPYDQGGHVKVEWTPSYLDSFPGFEIETYSIWRRAPDDPAPALTAGIEASMSSSPRTRGGRWTTAAAGQVIYWEQIGSMAARGLSGYSFVASTTSDSLPGANPRTWFMVMAETAGGTPYWASAPDSGYSTDDLAPPMPAPFEGTYAAGATTMSWGECPAPDFASFRLHRGHTAGFVPDAGNLVTAVAATEYTDAAGAPYFYKLCAVDVHGNASPYAFLRPAGTVDVPEARVPAELWLASPVPNPVRGLAAIRFGLPRAATVTMRVLDLQGREVRVLASGPWPAGEHVLRWDGCDAQGRPLASGAYFCRLEVEGRAFVRRLAVLR